MFDATRFLIRLAYFSFLFLAQMSKTENLDDLIFCRSAKAIRSATLEHFGTVIGSNCLSIFLNTEYAFLNLRFLTDEPSPSLFFNFRFDNWISTRITLLGL